MWLCRDGHAAQKVLTGRLDDEVDLQGPLQSWSILALTMVYKWHHNRWPLFVYIKEERHA